MPVPNIFTKKGDIIMKKLVAALSTLAITSLSAQTLEILPGWQLLGAASDINASTSFANSCIDIVWKFDSVAKKWSAYSPKSSIQTTLRSQNLGPFTLIEKGKGFWVKANSSCSIDTTPTPTLYDLLAGKTFYVVGKEENGDIWYGKVVFNKTLTSLDYIPLVGDESPEIERIQVEGNKIIWTSNDGYTIVGEKKEDYIELIDYSNDDTIESHTRAYFDKTKADAYYYSLTDSNGKLYDLLAGKTYYTYQYDAWGIWRSAYYFNKNGTLSVIDCQGHNDKWQNCEEPWVTGWKVENDILKLSSNDTNCSFSAEAEYADSFIDGFALHIKNVVDSCDPSENCTDCGNERFYTTNKTPYEVLKNAFVGKKLRFGNETFYFRQNDIVIADSGDDPTKIASYGGIVDNKLKVLYSGDEGGEYDLISRNPNGFTIEFFEKSADGVVRANGEESTTTPLQEFSHNEIENVLGDLDELSNPSLAFSESMLKDKMLIVYKPKENGKPSYCITFHNDGITTIILRTNDEILQINGNWYIQEGTLVFTPEDEDNDEYQIWKLISYNNGLYTYKNYWYLSDGTIDDTDTRQFKIDTNCPIDELVND